MKKMLCIVAVACVCGIFAMGMFGRMYVDAQDVSSEIAAQDDLAEGETVAMLRGAIEDISSVIASSQPGVNVIAQDLAGSESGNVAGGASGDVTGNAAGASSGDATGNVTGGASGDATGNVADADSTGNATGGLTGDTTGQQAETKAPAGSSEVSASNADTKAQGVDASQKTQVLSSDKSAESEQTTAENQDGQEETTEAGEISENLGEAVGLPEGETESATETLEEQTTAEHTANIEDVPVISVTVPTSIGVMLLSQANEDGLNIFSESFDIVNKSEVPIVITLSSYSFESDYEGEFGGSFLELYMVHCSEKSEYSLDFDSQWDVLELELEAFDGEEDDATYAGNAVRFSYSGYADRELNSHMLSNPARFSLVFGFKPVM